MFINSFNGSKLAHRQLICEILEWIRQALIRYRSQKLEEGKLFPLKMILLIRIWIYLHFFYDSFLAFYWTIFAEYWHIISTFSSNLSSNSKKYQTKGKIKKGKFFKIKIFAWLSNYSKYVFSLWSNKGKNINFVIPNCIHHIAE